MIKRESLATIVAENLSKKIASGVYKKGQQLPTEAELCAEYVVSRTVVREAIARLRSLGLVIPRPGKGVFVSEASLNHHYTLSQEMLKTLAEMISLLELRLSVEVEAAGLSAERRTDEELEYICYVMNSIDGKHEDPSLVQIHYDYDFHLAIAKSSHNKLIVGFLKFLKPFIYPNFQLNHIVDTELKDDYYTRIHNEHKAIVTAIEKSDPIKARKAMRVHLSNSLERVRALAHASGIKNADSEHVSPATFAELLARKI